MMDLLGAGNPYMARRFAEGGEASNLKESDPYGWNVLYAPKVTEIKSTYQQQVEALKEQERQLRLKAEQDARSEAQSIVQSAIDAEIQKNAPSIEKYQDNIAQINNMLAGKVGEIVLTYPGYGTENWKRGQLDEENLRQILAGNQRMIAEASDPQAARDKAFRQVVKNNPDVFAGDVWDNYAFWGQLAGQTIPLDSMQQILVDNLTAPAVGKLQEQYVQPIYSEVEKLTRTYDSNLAAINQDYARHKKLVREDMLRGIAPPPPSAYAPLPTLVQTPPTTPSATPTAPSATPTAPVQGGAPQAPTIPTAPVTPPVPVPSLPGASQQPVSNLTPQPMPVPGIGTGTFGGVPQPGIGALPAYQTPTAQAQRPTEQQPQMQIQYGPIGQAATSSSDLLKNLLAATQQSSPYDFTKNNPYLMQNQPVQFFAEGGEVKPPAQPVANVDLSWFRNPNASMSEPEFKRGVEAYGSVSAFKSALERYNRDYAQYVINYAENELSKGRYAPGAVASAYEQAASSPVFSSGERENFLAKAASFNTQQQQLDEDNAAQRAAQDLVISRFQAFNPLEQELTKKAYEEYENRKNYFQGLFQQQKQDLLQQYLNTPGPKDRAAYTKSIDRLSMQDDVEMAAAREALDKNLAFIRGTREQMRLGDVDTSNLMLPYLFTKPEPVPVQEPPPTLVPTTPTTPTTPAPVETTPAPSPIPVPVIGQQPSLPAPTIPTAPQIPISNLTPQPMPGITAPPSIGGIPQPGMGIFASQQSPLYQSILPSYQTPQTQTPSTTQQQPQMQIQYGPIGQGAVGQTNLLNTLLANQQDPTKVSLLGFDNPYLMKPFG